MLVFLNRVCSPQVTPDSRDSAGQARDNHRTQGLCHWARYAEAATLSDVNQQTATLHQSTAERTFTVLLSPTRRGARLARLLAVAHLDLWGQPSATAAQVVAELAANAALHGRVSGRDFQLRLVLVTETRLRIEVTDTRGDSLPAMAVPDPLAERGRGLLIVEALADRWGVVRGPVPRKTIWAELDLVR